MCTGPRHGHLCGHAHGGPGCPTSDSAMSGRGRAAVALTRGCVCRPAMQVRKNPEEPGSALCRAVPIPGAPPEAMSWSWCRDARCARSSRNRSAAGEARVASLCEAAQAFSRVLTRQEPGSSDAMRSRAASGPWPSPARALASVACTPRWACRVTSWASSLAPPTCAPVPRERSERPANAGERTGSKWSGSGRQICCSRARSPSAHSHLAAAARSARQPASTLTTSPRTP